MLKKCNLELIKKYVTGEDLEENYIEELENNVDFMKDVINYTNDKNMYNLCSDEVKSNYGFVKFLFKKFNEDKKFIYNVLLYFVKNKEKDDPQSVDIILKLRDVSKIINEDTFCKCCAKLESIYFDFRVGIEDMKNGCLSDIDQEIISESNMGFSLLYESYKGYNEVLTHFASLYVYEIFNDSGLELEKVVHKVFLKRDDLEKYGITRFIIDIIGKYDLELSSYASCHKEVLEDALIPFSRILRNWDWFMKNNEKIRYEIIFEQVDKIMDDYQNYCSFGGIEILYYIAEKLGVEKDLLKNDKLTIDDYKNIKKLIDIEINEKDFTLTEINVFNKIKKMMLNVLSQRVVEEVEVGMEVD